jgi:hypothetical protein
MEPPSDEPRVAAIDEAMEWARRAVNGLTGAEAILRQALPWSRVDIVVGVRYASARKFELIDLAKRQLAGVETSEREMRRLAPDLPPTWTPMISLDGKDRLYDNWLQLPWTALPTHRVIQETLRRIETSRTGFHAAITALDELRHALQP